MNREAAIAPYSSLCYRFCTSFEPKPQEIVMALFTKEESLAVPFMDIPDFDQRHRFILSR